MSSRTVLFFKDADGFGWSETFYYNATSINPTFTNNMLALANARAGILTNTCRITHCRVQSAVKRNPYIVSLNNGAGIPGAETPPTAPAEVALLIRTNAGAVAFNRAFLRGIPERVVQAESYVPDLAFTGSLNAFFTVLANGQFNVVSRGGGTPVQVPISTMVPHSPRGYTINLVTPGTPAVGQVIRVSGGRVPGYNGIKTIVTVNLAGNIISVGGASPPVNDNGTAAFYVVLPLTDTQLTDSNVIGLSRRAAGRPFGLSRGRRPTLYTLRR